MNILSQLASSLGRSDEEPNIELAKHIAREGNHQAVAELVAATKTAVRPARHDAIKVLYEIGASAPELISPYADDFMTLLKSSDNRMQWGAMTAIATIAQNIPDQIAPHLAQLESSSSSGSVITRDNYIKVLVAIAGSTKHRNEAIDRLRVQLLTCPVNQLPMYAELVVPMLKATADAKGIADILRSRLESVDKQSKRARIEKVIKQLS
jgi:hypothetical protein